MNLLLVTPWFPTVASPESGVFVLRDAAALAAEHRVTVLHLDWNGDADSLPGVADGFELRRVRLHRRRAADYGRARRLVRELARQADVVHTHALPGLLPFLVGRPGAGAPWVHTEHWSGLTSPETLSRVERALRGVLMRKLAQPDSVVVQCERLARSIAPLRRGGRIDLVPCVVDDPERVVPAPHDPSLLRLVGVGGLVERKGPLVALGAVKELLDRGVAANLTWVGDGPLRDAMRARAEELGIPDRLRLTGTLSPAGVGAELDAADVFVLPTLGDNFCVVAAEALVHGRPLVSGSETGAVDYARPEVSEFVPEHAAAAFADAIRRVVTKTASLSETDIAGTVRGAFTSQLVARRLAEVYRAVTSA